MSKGENSNKIAFLSNNLIVTKPLYDWLESRGEHVILFDKKISSYDIINNDISFVISYNYIHMIQSDVLDILPHRVINLHISLLPWNRGADPNIWSFIENTPCGVTIHEVDPGLDTGDILLQKQVSFEYSKDTLQSSYLTLHNVIQDLFKTNSANILDCTILPQPQTGKGSFHYKKDLLAYKDIINFNDTINDFINKINKPASITPQR